MTTETESCGGCIFFAADAERGNDGRCRRYPPMPVHRRLAIQPGVRREGWCGEFESMPGGEDAS